MNCHIKPRTKDCTILLRSKESATTDCSGDPETTITLSSICIQKQSLQCCCSPNFGKQTGRIPQTLHHLQAGASSLLFLLKFCSFSLLPTENKGSREAKEKGGERKFTLAPMEGKGRKEKYIYCVIGAACAQIPVREAQVGYWE